MIKLDPASAETVTEITTAANGTFVLNRKLDKPSALFSVAPPSQVTAQSSQSVIDALNADSRVVHAYPAFVNPATGKRHFLNNEIVVRLRAPITPDNVTCSG